ncbi:protein kinase [Flammeovirga sp. SubArs3]|uniref:serine/threonine protein kinase n=1 Tax=Flammeovirga sp. SubArs3 TaxID=2995316 RepID=UPI00248C3E5F|nr:protein kinase [Flammeovirga sp. SubArs3]
MLNQTIFNYKLTKEIGEGGMATVYLGIHENLETPAAIKVLHKNFTKNEKVRQRFINEAKALYSLSHPYIVRLLNYDDNGEHLIMILEYVDGVDLKEYIQKHPEIKSVDNAIPFFAKVLEAFAYAHKKGLVHRDIKPSNIMVNKDGNPVILDFGIAKLQDNMEASLTGTNALMGSRPYMSPEQIKSAKHLDHRSDIYSLGVTLYQLLTGENAYDTTTLSEWDVMNKIVTEPLPRASSKNSDVTSAIEKVIDKATAKDVTQRYQNCVEFIEALVNYKMLEQAEIDYEATVYEEALPSKSVEDTIIEENLSSNNTTSNIVQSDKKSEKNVINEDKESKNKLPLVAAGIVGFCILFGVLFYSFTTDSSDHLEGENITLSEAPAVGEENTSEEVTTQSNNITKSEIDESSEDESWSLAQKENSITSYKSYLSSYPNGEYTIQAEKKIKTLREESLWVSSKKKNTVSAYENYLSYYPQGKFKTSARSRINKLKADAIDAEEVKYWNFVKEQNTITAYSTYLSYYPQGKYKVVAQKKIEELKTNQASFEERDLWASTKRQNTISAYEYYLRSYPYGVYKTDAELFISTLKIENEEINKEEEDFWAKAIRTNTESSYNTYLLKYPKGKHVNEAKEFLKKFKKVTSIRGHITDEYGNALPGVTVIVQGTNTGTISDLKGNYSLSVKTGETIYFSFIGYEKKYYTIGTAQNITTALKATERKGLFKRRK